MTTRTYTGFDNAGAWEDVSHRYDLCRVFRINDCRTTWHRQNEVAEQRPKGQVFDTELIQNDRALRLTDDVIVHQVTAVGAISLAGLECDCVQSTFRTGKLNAISGTKWAGR
jgi:hypothetical protein